MSKEETYFLADGCMISADSTLISRKKKKTKGLIFNNFYGFKTHVK